MKPFIVFVLLLAAFISCWNDDDGYQDSLDNQKKMGLLQILLGYKACSTDGFKLSDKTDGTIETSGACYIVHYKKCLQGQVFRKEENDCKGIGDESNNFGARIFKWDNLEAYYKDKPDKSCQDDNFNNRKWEIVYYKGISTAVLKQLSISNATLLNQCVSTGIVNYNNIAECIHIPSGDYKYTNITEGHYLLCSSTDRL